MGNGAVSVIIVNAVNLYVTAGNKFGFVLK